MSDQPRAAIAAAGKMTEALERLERARGHLYAFHQQVGETDFMLDDVVAHLRAAGRADLAERLEHELVGRDVIPGHWTFEVVEEFDETYWSVFRDHERALREALTDGRRHVFEAQLKERRQGGGRGGERLRGQRGGVEG